MNSTNILSLVIVIDTKISLVIKSVQFLFCYFKYNGFAVHAKMSYVLDCDNHFDNNIVGMLNLQTSSVKKQTWTCLDMMYVTT